ncbi:MAG TPA: hypothetical protein VK203_27755 [Nostocaceae cyanobacterium]|nr:hypothetical protein [Nostocaceae cyanobacterium]
MEFQKYRFNRKDGIIYLENANQLIPQDSQMQMIILSASKPEWKSMFGGSPTWWIQLIFTNTQGQMAYAWLNSGTTNALETFLSYRANIEQSGKVLYEVITTFSLVQGDGDFFDYHFTGVPGKPGLKERMEAVVSGLSRQYESLV